MNALPGCTRVAMRVKADAWLLAILMVSAALGAFHIEWGLPNGNASWAIDAPGPLTVLQVCWKSIGSFNSGWFWFKYPLGYPLLLAIAYAPYLLWLRLTGAWFAFSTEHPYGLVDPEGTLYVLALIGRGVNVVLVTATVAITYAIARRLVALPAARLAAWLTATAYPLVYYAHTTNQDAAYLCWLTLALWAALVAGQERSRRGHLLLGFAAAMAMATKEQGFAWLLVLPVLLVAAGAAREPGWRSPWNRMWRAAWNADVGAGVAAAAVTYAVASNAIINPLGVWNRFQDLRGHPVEGLSARLTPVEFSLFKGVPKEMFYVRQLADVVESSLGPALLVAAVLGILYLLVRRPRVAAWLFLPALFYYVLSLRTHDVLALRYVLPLLPVLAIAAAAVCWEVYRRRPLWGGILIGGLCLVSLARAIELETLLVRDPRYAAERWMRQRMTPSSAVEVYQKPAYLPRFQGVTVRHVPMAERGIAHLLARDPDYLVISSSGRRRIFQFWNRDWKKAGSLLSEDEDAAAFLAALESGALPYRLVASFAPPEPVLLRPRITSIGPQIRIYGRRPS